MDVQRNDPFGHQHDQPVNGMETEDVLADGVDDLSAVDPYF